MRFANLTVLLSLTILSVVRPTVAQDSLSADDPFNTGAFDEAVTTGTATDAKNKLVYLPGIFFVSEATGSLDPDDGTYGSDTRFYGKVFVKASKADIGALYLGANFNYFLYASANNPYYRAFYQLQSPDPRTISATLSEFHFSFDVKKVLFVRVGSQLISWGATYFWSPEDFINQQKAQAAVLTAIDARTGKPGLRLHLPLGSMNIFLFTDFSSVVRKGSVGNLGETVAQAWRIDGTIRGVNLGTVGYVADNKPVQIGFDATGNVLGADIYGELALSIEDTADEAVDASFSVGASRTFGQEKTWTGRVEFYYNDRGYADTALSTLPVGSFTPFYSGRYYSYAEVSNTRLFTSILGASLFGYANLADRSYAAALQFSFDIPGILPFSIYGRYFGGRADREFTSTFGGQSLQAGVRISGEF